MKKRCVFCTIVLVIGVAISLLLSKNSGYIENVDCTTLDMSVVDLPQGFTYQNIKVTESPFKKQVIYLNEGEIGRLVLEITTLNSAEEQGDMSKFVDSESDENEFRWSKGELSYRVFGKFSNNQLESIAESVKVYSNE